MRKFKLYLWVALLFVPLLSIAQDADEELVTWNPGKRLTWADYKGKPDPSSDAAASTATYLGINYNISSSNVTYKITCRFSKDRSWGKYKSEYILSHEQGHFDITEIFARKLNKMMSEYKFNRGTYQHDLEKIYQDILDEKEIFQNQYDNETDYSRNKEKQAAWLKKIEKVLDDLKDYGDYN